MFEERIARGMALLDKRFPGWWLNINVDRLDMSKPDFYPLRPPSCGCVLAQVDTTHKPVHETDHGSYLELVYILENLGDLSEEVDYAVPGNMGPVSYHGFSLPMREWNNPQWEQLTKEWKAAIQERRFHTDLPNG